MGGLCEVFGGSVAMEMDVSFLHGDTVLVRTNFLPAAVWKRTSSTRGLFPSSCLQLLSLELSDTQAYGS